MVQCVKCGMQNADGSKFCRFCGVALMQSSGDPSRKPYSWQSEEFQLNDRTQNHQAKPTQVFNQPQNRPHQPQSQPQQSNYQQRNNAPQMVQPLQHHPQQQMQMQPVPLYGGHSPQYYYGHQYCPNCRTQVIPRMKRKISQAGWIVFAVLLVSIPPLFWIGLCIREDRKACPICNTMIDRF